MNDYVYYVYSHVDPRNGNTFYVGHGARGRAWIHGSKRTCLRSQDHLAGLDDLTDSGYIATDWVHIIKKGLSKSDACFLEQSIIRDISPEYNKPQGLQHMKINEEIFNNINSLREEGVSYKDIGVIVGLSAMTVYRAVNKQTKNIGNW